MGHERQDGRWDERRRCLVRLFALGTSTKESSPRPLAPSTLTPHSHHTHATSLSLALLPLAPHPFTLHPLITPHSLASTHNTTLTRTTYLLPGDGDWRLCLAAGLLLIEINGRE